MKKAILFICILQSLWADNSTLFPYNKEFEITKGTQATLELSNQKSFITIDGKKNELAPVPNFDDLKDFDLLLLQEELVKIDDYNFDGYKDFAIIDGIGYGGVNIFRSYYLYNPQQKNYQRALESTSTLNIEGDRLTTSFKSGINYYQQIFKVTNGTIYKAKETENNFSGFDLVSEFDAQGKLIATNYSPDSATILTPKAFLYTANAVESKTKAYLIQGDKVKILKLNSDTSMAKIEYRGKNAPLVRWIELETIAKQ